ncbi:MAG TPA: hypothetical protein ENL35_04420 [Chloroflexi bacterium]|nr:hypothetical protein [Chloroflexota bacterium]
MKRFVGALMPLLLLAACGTAQAHRLVESIPKATQPAVGRTPLAPVEPSPAPTQGEPTPTLIPACEEREGTLVATHYPGAVVEMEVPVQVYLPPCYAGDVSSRYPVLYLLHGYPHDEQHWLGLGLQEHLDRGIGSEGWPPFLVVMPLQPEPLFTQSDGGPGSYEQEFLEGVIPFIDATYRTVPEAWARALAGISRGGVWALEIGLRHADRIGTLAALSPALVHNSPRPAYDPFVIAGAQEAYPAHIFLSAGDGEAVFRGEIERFSEHLQREGLSHEFLRHPGGHTEASWAGVLDQVLSFVVDSWQ